MWRPDKGPAGASRLNAEENALEGQKALRRGQRARAEAVPTSIS